MRVLVGGKFPQRRFRLRSVALGRPPRAVGDGGDQRAEGRGRGGYHRVPAGECRYSGLRAGGCDGGERLVLGLGRLRLAPRLPLVTERPEGRILGRSWPREGIMTAMNV